MTLLDDIIDAATSSAVTTPDLLRKVKVVAHRVGASAVLQWVNDELNGYAEDVDLPAYRLMETPVIGTYAGPMHSFIEHPLSIAPPDMKHYFEVQLRQPVLELQALAQGPEDKNPGVQWTSSMVEKYEKSGIFGLEWHSLFKARNVVTRESLVGVVDVIRTKALDFALELQTAFPDAGETGGPTAANEPALAQAVVSVTNHIYGDGTNVAAGSNITQKSQVVKGDADSLRTAVREVLGDSDEAEEFTEAVLSAQNSGDEKVHGIVKRVRAGSINVLGAIGTGVAADLLLKIAKAYLGG